ncbi:MAG: hypothetical protein HKN09_08385 [Saprospiraceae bacterium]|nr:hypothetical protein [Saprospiraceae bacterium]
MNTYKSIFTLQISPFRQAVAIGLVTLLVMLVAKGLLASGAIAQDPPVFWECAFTMLMIYMLFTAVWSISYRDKSKYLLHSIIGYVAVAFVGGFLAQSFSGLTMDEAGGFKMMYIIFTVSYLIFMGIVNAMRTILEIVKKQDARLRGEIEN